MSDDKDDIAAQEELEDERDFLLRSLDDLESELLAGNIDPDTYRVLHDDYTARASAVITSIADGVERRAPTASRVPAGLRFVTIGGIVVFALLAAFLLAHSAGQRRPGQTITGNSQAGGTPTTASPVAAIDAAKATAAAQPKSYDARITYARTLWSSGPAYYGVAVREYIVAAQLDPKQPEPLAYTGWLTALLSRGETDKATQNSLLDVATTSLDRAITLDPTYPDSYVFKGLVLTQFENKQCAGALAFQQYLVRAPANDPMHAQVLDALAQAVKAGKCPTTTPTTKP